MSGAKNHHCNICNATFRHKYSYLRHKIVKHETGRIKKDFMCEICGKTFLVKSLLVQHMQSKTHGGPGLTSSSSQRQGHSSNNSGTRVKSHIDLTKQHKINSRSSSKKSSKMQNPANNDSSSDSSSSDEDASTSRFRQRQQRQDQNLHQLLQHPPPAGQANLYYALQQEQRLAFGNESVQNYIQQNPEFPNS
jgi:hypothetical protein